MHIDSALDDVRDFHRKMRSPISRSPSLLRGNATAAGEFATRIHALADETASVAAASGDVLLTRAAMAMEELAEWVTAHERSDLIAAADAWADRAYVLFGDAVAAGLPTEKLFVEVHRSNMTKESDSADGGKAVKGAAYEPPRIADILKGLGGTDIPKGTSS